MSLGHRGKDWAGPGRASPDRMARNHPVQIYPCGIKLPHLAKLAKLCELTVFLFGLNRTDINTGQFFADYWWARSDVTILVIHLVAIECHVLRSVLKLLLSSQKYHPRSFRMKHFAPKIHAEFE